MHLLKRFDGQSTQAGRQSRRFRRPRTLRIIAIAAISFSALWLPVDAAMAQQPSLRQERASALKMIAERGYCVVVWPRAAVDAFVGLADGVGQPSMGDAIVMMSWLGVRRQDWLYWPAAVFDRELVTFAQEKTDKALVLPWSLIPPLAGRVAAAKARRTSQGVSATTFFHDSHGLPWSSASAFRKAFNALREELMKQHPYFPTRYYVGIDPVDPLRLPTSHLTMRTMRHTCVTLNHDAGVPRELISSITGHEPANIDAVLAHYTARTADQATAALNMRIAHEAKSS